MIFYIYVTRGGRTKTTNRVPQA